MNKKLLVVMAVTIWLAAGSAAAQHGPPALKKTFMKTRLGLDDRQIDKIEELTYRADREKLDIHHELQKARLDLRHMMDAERPEEKAVFAQLEKIAALELDLKKNRIGLMLAVRKLLTPEQWEKMELFHARRQERRRARRTRRIERRFDRRMDAPDSPEGPGEPPLPPPGL